MPKYPEVFSNVIRLSIVETPSEMALQSNLWGPFSVPFVLTPLTSDAAAWNRALHPGEVSVKADWGLEGVEHYS